MYNKIFALAIVAVLIAGVFIIVNDDESAKNKLTSEIYTVTFDGNGGTAMATSMKVTYGQPYGQLPFAEIPDMEFVGWNTSSDGKGLWIDRYTIFEEHHDITLYAIYAYLNYVTYHLCLGGAENNPNNIFRYTKYQSFDLYPPTAPFGTFEGWWVDPDYKIFSLTHVNGSDFPTGIELYAKWSV